MNRMLTSRSSTFWNSLFEDRFGISVILKGFVGAATPATGLGGVGSWHDESPTHCNEVCLKQICAQQTGSIMGFKNKLTVTADPKP